MDIPIHVSNELRKITEQGLINEFKHKFPKSKIVLKNGMRSYNLGEGKKGTNWFIWIEIDDEVYLSEKNFYDLVKKSFFNLS